VLLQFHGRVERADETVLDDPCHSEEATVAPTEVRLHRQGHRVWRQLRRWKRWLRSNLLIAQATYGAPLVRCGGDHARSFSIRGDDENRYIAQLTEHVGDFIVFPVVPPNNPDPAAGWRGGEHLEGGVLAFLKAEDTVERGLDLLRPKTVGVDLL
jgi:hypothetical protein